MKVILYLLFSYMIGQFMTAYLLTRFYYKEDIRQKGSGNVGARNAGRVYGKWAAVITFLGDSLKGVVIIFLARYMSLSEVLQLTGLLLGIIGHIWPVFLRGKGGKGIATFIGGITAYQPVLLLLLILLFAIIYILKRRFTISGLISIGLLPLHDFLVNRHIINTVLIAMIVLIVLVAHTRNRKMVD